MAQHTGLVKWCNNAKGYGFVGVETGSDVFAHYSAIAGEGYKAFKEGDGVEYDIVSGVTGRPQAANVVKVKRAGAPNSLSTPTTFPSAPHFNCPFLPSRTATHGLLSAHQGVLRVLI